MSPPTTIYAKRRGSAPSVGESGEEARVLYLDVTIVPSEPLHVGQRIKILSLTSCDELFPSEEETEVRYYTAKDIGVWGTVVRLRVEEEKVAEFVLKNDNIQSDVTHAYLAVPRREGLTIWTPLWRRIWGAVLGGPSGATRTIPIEGDATVFENGNTLNFAGRTE
ncbi:hypothetical protein OH77DRAFT_671078 [Trametes cingulata]|nr:hypothetical protein OH77DRAFT_671078 [Trametes cingulata]